MRVSYFAQVLAVLVSVPFLLSAQTSFPRMATVDPMTAKVGDVVTVAGENLDKSNVSEVFLNDDKNDNRFNPPLARFSTIEEDAAPLYLLCNEYPPA